MTNERTGFGDKVECELWRNGELVPPDKPKPKRKYVVIKRPHGTWAAELIPKEKRNVKNRI